MIIPQDIPREIKRVCCPGKNDSEITLKLSGTGVLRGNAVFPAVGYRRDNGDWYFGPFENVDMLYLAVNDGAYHYRPRPHSRACGIEKHEHGPACHRNCPTCGGETLA